MINPFDFSFVRASKSLGFFFLEDYDLVTTVEDFFVLTDLKIDSCYFYVYDEMLALYLALKEDFFVM